MFSGIIAGQGTIVENNLATHRFAVKSKIFSDRTVSLGASIAIDGVCLTVVACDHDCITFDLGEETKEVTQLAKLSLDSLVNIEFSLRYGDEISGHLVQGHVDGVVSLIKRSSLASNLVLQFSYPTHLKSLLVKKGSLALNGVSLTINELDYESFSVCLLPYTLELTNLGRLKIGQKAHIEVDILGRYIARMLSN
ncbi:MAG: riboflavin synthase [Myxococcales bacterium]|nr:riboflavin synthase [Myxococcales bacterium]USN51076.1 MAG: riboflavin synthase [Myxococcales bacterium]